MSDILTWLNQLPVRNPSKRKRFDPPSPTCLPRSPPMTDNNCDTASLFSESPTLNRALAKRPKLTPSSPSKKSASRSGSPVRNLAWLLEQADPPVQIRQPGSTISTLPPLVDKLEEGLTRDIGIGVIPLSLKSRLQSKDPLGTRKIHSMAWKSAIDPNLSQPEPNSSEINLWEHVQAIHSRAERCHNDNKNESEWVLVVISVLKAAALDVDHEGKGLFEVNSIQTEAIHPGLLPILPESTQLAKKADLCLAFNKYEPEVRTAVSKILAAQPGVTLSQMYQGYTSQVPLVCGIEVKAPSGGMNYPEAVMQLGIWSAAGLQKLDFMMPPHIKDRSLYPFVGWTIEGHTWSLHLIWRESTGRINVLGPLDISGASTSSLRGIFALIDILKKIKVWMSEKYWPWFKRTYASEPVETEL